MPKAKIKNEEIRVYLSVAQKNKLKRLAELSQKSLSAYLLEAAFTGYSDKSDDDNGTIGKRLTRIMKTQLVMTQLMLLIGAEQLKSQDQIMKYYQECVEDADNRFGRE
ncbi:hypothetical protein [Dendrosporobacter sp. 1207_IL3150]|uniref:hypothetical protein n=1 Tax=Dendrosporobacter sp. 1207_IL3150 TaxID=3084054 RepID=UPI002FDA5A75